MATPGIKVVGGEKELQAITKELIELGKPSWVISRYTAALKQSMKPVLEAAKGFVPKDTHNLKNSLAVTSRRLKGSMLTEARVGVDAKAVFLRRNKDGGFDNTVAKSPRAYVASIEFGNKRGVAAQPFMRPAGLITGQPNHLVPRIHDFMRTAIRKRTNFLKKGVK